MTNQNLGIVSPTPSGTWFPGVTYQHLAIVKNGTASYIAKSQSTNVQPGVDAGWQTYWMLLNEDGGQGVPGNTGATGPMGPQGPEGPQGEPGAGLISGGTTGQILAKASNTNYDTKWILQSEIQSGRAISDGNGNNIAQTYETKSDAQSNQTSLQSQIQQNQTDITVNSKRLSNIEAGLPPSAWQTDDTVAYQKSVPANANPYSAITKIGGMSYNDNGVLRSSAVTSITSKGANISDISEPKIGYFFDGTGAFSSGIASFMGFYISSVQPNTEYTVSSNLKIYSIWQDDGTNPTTRTTVDNRTYTFTTSETTKRLRVSLENPSGSADTSAFEWFMINEGSMALPYKPYREPITTPLPVSVLFLNGYGLGVSSANCNYIDWRPAEGVKQYVQMCAERAYQSGDESLSNVVTDGSTKTVYVLATPVTTDLSTVLSDDNLFEVEGGGSLTFDNEYENAVPSTVIYQLDTNT